jgi:hypothetical protein
MNAMIFEFGSSRQLNGCILALGFILHIAGNLTEWCLAAS